MHKGSRARPDSKLARRARAASHAAYVYSTPRDYYYYHMLAREAAPVCVHTVVLDLRRSIVTSKPPAACA